MRIYFSGIGGVGIGPLAEIARDAGYDVLGSDAQSSLVTDRLENQGVPITYSQNGAFMRNQHVNNPIDWFVYTSALPSDHPELVLAQELGITTAKRDELLAHIIADKQLKMIAVAGTHGKTGTTGMMVWAMKQLGIPVSYSVGTTLSWGPSGKFDPESTYFVYECDEFDRNMLHFSPHVSLITSLDYDHPDTYPTKNDYTEAFTKFLQQSSHVVMWQRDAEYIDYTNAHSWILQDEETRALRLPGSHIRKNATLVHKTLEYLGLGDSEAVDKALENFPGTNRRFEKLSDNLYSDYGHHPVEIAATLQAANELSKDVVLVYQPHQNVRQHEVQEQYTNDIFIHCREIYWLPTYLSREDTNLPVLAPKDLTKHVTITPITYGDLNDELWSHIQIEIHKGHLVLCMGAGSIDGWLRQQLHKQ